MKKAHAFNVNLETTAFSLEQTRSLDFDPLYEIASNPVAWEQHPEKGRWKRPVFSAFFQVGMENDFGCFTICDKTAGVVIRSTRFYLHDASGEAVRLGYTFLCPTYQGSGAKPLSTYSTRRPAKLREWGG
jgi:N-acetyltransferase